MINKLMSFNKIMKFANKKKINYSITSYVPNGDVLCERMYQIILNSNKGILLGKCLQNKKGEQKCMVA